MSSLQINRPRSPPKMVLLNCKYDLTRMCRSCSNNKNDKKHVSLFQTVKIDDNNYVIADMLKQCTSLKIEIGDGLPIMICYQCIYDLITTYNFIRKCKKTDESFRQYIFNDNSDSLNALQNIKEKDIKIDIIENSVTTIKKEKPESEVKDMLEESYENDINVESIEYIDEKESDLNESNYTSTSNNISEDNINSNSSEIINEINNVNKERPIPPLIITNAIVPPNTFCIAVQDKNRKIRNVVVNRNKITHLNVKEDTVKKSDGRLLKINNLNLLIKNIPKNNKRKREREKKNEEEQEKENNAKDDIGELPDPKDRNVKIRRCSYSGCKKLFKFIKDTNFDEMLVKYKEHVNSHYNDEGFWCDLCPRRVTAQQFLDTHNRYSHKGRRCKKCKLVFKDRSEYFEHKKTHKLVRYTCKYCSRVFKTFKAYQLCEQKHEGNLEIFQCDQCDKSYKLPYELVVHKRRVHEKLNRYLCPICGRKFFFQYELERHEGIHKTERKVYKCELCDKQLLTKTSLTKHVISVHGKEDKRFECQMCPKKFLFKSNFNCHLRRHYRGNYKYKCQFCEKCYYSQRELRYHIQSHTGERPHKCPYCSKSYRRAQALTEHIRMHTGERPYKCELCSMTFARYTIYTKHKKLCQARANGERKRRNSRKLQVSDIDIKEIESSDFIDMQSEEIISEEYIEEVLEGDPIEQEPIEEELIEDDQIEDPIEEEPLDEELLEEEHLEEHIVEQMEEEHIEEEHIEESIDIEQEYIEGHEEYLEEYKIKDFLDDSGGIRIYRYKCMN